MQKNPHIFSAQKCVKVSPGFTAVFQITSNKKLKCEPNHGEFTVFSSVAQGNLGTNSKPGETLTQSCAEKYEGGFAFTA